MTFSNIFLCVHVNLFTFYFCNPPYLKRLVHSSHPQVTKTFTFWLLYLAHNGPKEEKKRNHVQFLRITFPKGAQPESQTSQATSPCVTNPESWRLQQVCLQTSVSSCGHRSCHTSRVTVSHTGCRIQRALRITTCTLAHLRTCILAHLQALGLQTREIPEGAV